MAGISQVGTALKNFSAKPMSIASKALGVATIASVLYDAHTNGKERAISNDEISTAYRGLNQLRQYKTMDKNSATTAKLKNLWYDVQQNFPFYHASSKTKGYLEGFGKTIINDVPLLALSAVSIKFKTAGKVAGTLLAANGLKTLLYDVIGIGNDKPYFKHYGKR